MSNVGNDAAQCPFSFQKLNVDKSCQETRTIRCYILEVLSSFTVFPQFLQYIFGGNSAQSPSHLKVQIFSISSKHFSSRDVNRKRVSSAKVLEKFQMCVETQTCAQSSLQKLNVDKSYEKARKIRYWILEVFSNFTVFLQLVSIILASITSPNKFLA